MAREWLYNRLPRTLDRSIVDSLLDSYGDTEQQAEMLAEAGSPVADSTRWWPFQEGGQWKIGPGIPIGPVDNLDETQASQLQRWQSDGLIREAGYARLIEHAQKTQSNVRMQLKRANIPDAPREVEAALAEVYIYEETPVIPDTVVRALKNRDYDGAFQNVAQTATVAPAPVLQETTARAVEIGNQSGSESLVTEVMRNTAINETGRANYSRMDQIAKEANGTKSYGILGLNSGTGASGSAFVAQFGERLGLTAPIGSTEFDQQWQGLTANNPDALIDAHEEYVEAELIAPAQTMLTRNGLGAHRDDPGMINMVSDMVVQYGPGLTASNLKQAAELGSTNTQDVIRDITQTTVSNVDRNFRTHLSQFPEQRQGLVNRLQNRGEQSLKLSQNYAPTNDRPLTQPAPNSAPVTAQSPINVASNGGDASLPFIATQISPEITFTEAAGDNGLPAGATEILASSRPTSRPVDDVPPLNTVPTQAPTQEPRISATDILGVDRVDRSQPFFTQLGQAIVQSREDLRSLLTGAGQELDVITDELGLDRVPSVPAIPEGLTRNLDQNILLQGARAIGNARADLNAGLDGNVAPPVTLTPQEQVILDAQGAANPDIRDSRDLEAQLPTSAFIANTELAQPAAGQLSSRDQFAVDQQRINDFLTENLQQVDVAADVQQRLDEQRNQLRRNAIARVLGLSQQNTSNAGSLINSSVANLDRLRNALGTGETPRTQISTPPQLSATSLVNTLGALQRMNSFGGAQDTLSATNAVLNERNAADVLTGGPGSLSVQDTLPVPLQANSLFETRSLNDRIREEALAANQIALDNVGRRNSLLDGVGRLNAINGQLRSLGIDPNEALSPIFDDNLALRRFRDNNNTVAR